jgi:hypothetical protein
MQQRQPRLGDILDDYCPRERRLTNHAVVAMVGDDVKQTRCTTCDAEHEYKHARVPRPRRKDEGPAALQGQPVAVPKRVVPDAVPPPLDDRADETPPRAAASEHDVRPADGGAAPDESPDEPREVEGPVHRRLIRAALPRHEGQQSPGRAAPEFTIRQPGGGRPNRFRPRHARGHQGVDGSRSGQSGGHPGGSSGRHGGGPVRGGSAGHGHGHGRTPAMTSRSGRPRHSGRKGPK